MSSLFWWNVENPDHRPHPDDEYPRALLCDRGHWVRQHSGPGAKPIGLTKDPDLHDPRVRLRRSDRGDLPSRHLPPVRPVGPMLFWQLIVLQIITFAVLAVVLHQFLYRQVTGSL